MNKGNPTGKKIQNVFGRKKVDHPSSPLFRINVFIVFKTETLIYRLVKVLCFHRAVIVEIFRYLLFTSWGT